MSGVVIRCPNCGTTQSALGECEACHEATTRYFCPNHEPGRWLDGPSCPECGARVGVPGVTRPPPSPSRPATPPPAHRAPRRTPPREEIRPPEDEWVDADVDAGSEPWRGPVFSPRDPRIERGRPDPGDPWRLDPSMLPSAVRVVSLFGCLRRLVMIALVLLVLFAIGFFSLFGGFVFGSELPGSDAAGSGREVVVTLLRARDSTRRAAIRPPAPPSPRIARRAP